MLTDALNNAENEDSARHFSIDFRPAEAPPPFTMLTDVLNNAENEDSARHISIDLKPAKAPSSFTMLTDTLNNAENEDSARHIAIDLKPAEVPPQVTVYEPDFFLCKHGNIISHDHHLNKDGEALYRFLLAQAVTPPTYILRIVGTHIESRSRQVKRNGKWETEYYDVTVTDFDFPIDLQSYIVRGPDFWSCPDSDPAYRGHLVRQLRTEATDGEISGYYRWRGGVMPPWQAPDGSTHTEPQASSLTPRQWADEYVASPKLFKEFVFRKVIYGWDTNKLANAIAFSINSTSYTGKVNTFFGISGTKITIRPSKCLSRALFAPCTKFLLIITLIYPFLWLFKRFHRYGGGKWKVVGAAYGLTHFEPLDASPDAKTVGTELEQRHPIYTPRVVETPYGLQKLTGYREGEWLREWEPLIKRCVERQLETNTPLTHPRQRLDPATPLEILDGYYSPDTTLPHPAHLRRGSSALEGLA